VGGQGEDSITMTGNNNIAYGEGDNDTMTSVGDNTYLNGNDGNDHIASAGNDSTLWGGAGNDILVAVGNANYLGGESGDDILVAGGAGALALAQVDEGFAQALQQTIGNTEGVTLDGGDGNDTLIGSFGNDTLIGGEGADTFIYNMGEGLDTIVGGAGDVLEIQGGLLGDITDDLGGVDFASAANKNSIEAFLSTTEDGSSASITFSQFNGSIFETIGRVDFDLEAGEMIETIRVGELEYNAADMFESAYVTSDFVQNLLDNSYENLVDMDAMSDQLETALDVAIDEGGQTDFGDAVAVADAFAQIDELANGEGVQNSVSLA
jgi:hypothetical protein